MRVSIVIIVAVLLMLSGVAGCASWTAERQAPPIGRFVYLDADGDVDGTRMHVLDAGPRDSAKPPVVLIHGASANLRDMKIALGDALASDRRVIMVDRPGRGYSSRPRSGYALGVQAQAIKKAVDALGVEKPIVVGQSLGGAVALRYALQYQDDMSALVVLAPVTHEWPGGVAWYNAASQWPVAGFLLRRLIVPLYGQLTAKDGIDETFAPDPAPEDYYNRSGLPLLFRAKDFKSNASDLYNLKDEIIAQQGRYAELTLPVAIVTGTDDTTVSPEIHSKTLAREVDQSSLTLLPDTGHALHHSEAARILEIIETLSQQ